jgi:hypothetical protein
MHSPFQTKLENNKVEVFTSATATTITATTTTAAAAATNTTTTTTTTLKPAYNGTPRGLNISSVSDRFLLNTVT